MLAPVRWRQRIGLHFRLHTVGILQQGEEAIDFRTILVLRLFNCGLSQIVSEYVFGVHSIHPVTPLVVATLFTP